ncbi:MAG: response regulator transcription factor [Actinomycetes bacterium]
MTGVALSELDVRRVLDVVAACRDGGDAGEILSWPLMQQLYELVACDSLSAWCCDPVGRNSGAGQEWPRPDPQDRPDDDADAFWAHFWGADCSYPDRTGDLVSVTMTSDFASRQAYHDSGMYIDYLRQWGVEYEVMVCLPAGPGRTMRLLFARGDGPDFTERDRAVLILLRPHLRAAYEARERGRHAVAPLTARQREILQYVAAGLGNRQIARRLGLSESTVGKHLEHIFARLEVTSRTAAVSRAALSV